MSGFTKLFSTIIHSTVWRAEPHVKIVWITLLAMADRLGRVEASLPGLADAARVSIDEAEAALTVLSSPDPYSRTRDYDGRRIRAIDGGWQLLNYLKYREARTADERRFQVREAVARHRAKQVEPTERNVINPVISNHDVSQCKPMQKQKQKQNKIKTVSSEAAETAVSVPTPTLCEFAVIGTGGTRWAFTDAHRGELAVCYPGVDILGEVLKAKAWIDASPDRRKTQRGMSRFLVSWLNRSVDNRRGPAPVAATGKGTASAAAALRAVQRLHDAPGKAIGS